MKELQTDILIVGGGLTGLLAAYALSALKKEIIIIDKLNLEVKNYSSDFRTTAISEGSKGFFDKIKIWDDLKKNAQQIKHIHVRDRDLSRNIDFQNLSTQGFLGYIIENKKIKNILIKKLKTKKNIKIISNQSFTRLVSNSSFSETFFQNYKIKSGVIIAADGKKSPIRNSLKVPVYKKEYPHKAIVINFHHTKNHNNTAYELFYKSGPLAILPMKKNKKNLFSSSVIWSNENDYISSFAKVKKDIMKSILQEKIFSIVGEVIKIENFQVFDLSAHINFQFNQERLIFIGDSAHSIHPIAGQGWNLGVRDIWKCYKVLSDAEKLGLDIGSPSVLNKFNDLCYYDAFNLYQITDKLNSIFINDSFLGNSIRAFGFKTILKSKNIKKIISNYAMGIN